MVILLKVLLVENTSWQSKDLAQALFLSPTEISFSLKRCQYARLLDGQSRNVSRRTFFEFLFYGLPVTFPTQPGEQVRGMPTAHSAAPLSQQVVAGQLYVWPDAESDSWGCAIEPLYPRVLQAAKADARLYELLALADALRVGRPRERKLAGDLLKAFIMPANV
ncbi:hypothetical protein GCM10022406_28030 [Hymenobacter algoricola]|uniref:Transcriptional regulator n=1 Tax=Hymenobacter algoricola TaxID=486267 RepID=A0ABP7NDQ5_9BACT